MTGLQISALMTMGLAGCLLLLGRWGRNPHDERMPSWHTPEDRLHAVAVQRRGARACLAFGVMLMLAGCTAMYLSFGTLP